MSYRIIIDRTLCNGFGACVEADPDDFEVGADGLAVARAETTAGAAAVEAARACPMGAITIVDDAGREVR